jgi:hypothetical protein
MPKAMKEWKCIIRNYEPGKHVDQNGHDLLEVLYQHFYALRETVTTVSQRF